MDALAAVYEPDAVVWHAYDDSSADVAGSARTLRWLHRTVPDLAFDDVAVVPTASGFVWQVTMRGTGPGGPFHLHSCQVVTLSPAGRVARVDEYVDSAGLAPLRGAN